MSRLAALALLGFGAAGAVGAWTRMPAEILLVGLVWLPGVVALGPCVVACDNEGRRCPLRGPGRLCLEACFSLLLLVAAVLPLFVLGSELGAAALTLGVSYTLLGVAGLCAPLRRTSQLGAPAPAWPAWAAFGVAVAVLAPAVHHWAGATVDDWWDLAFIRAYAWRPLLSFAEPVLDSGAVHPRFAWNVWLVLQALVARFAPDGAGATLQAGALPVVVCVLVVSATSLLAGAIFEHEGSRPAMAAVLFVPCWLYGTEALPFFTRLHQDKFVAGLVLVPVLLAMTTHYLRSPRPRLLVLTGAAASALCSVHGLMFAIGLIGVGACIGAELGTGTCRAGSSTTSGLGPTSRPQVVALAAVVCVPLLYPAWQAWALGSWFNAQGIDLGVADNPVVRAHLRLGRLVAPHSAAYVVRPAAVFGPVAMVAAGGLLAALRGRRRRDRAYLLWLTLLPCALVFVPYLAAATGRVVVPWMLYRVAWLVPVALLAGYLVDVLASRCRSSVGQHLAVAACAGLALALAVPVAADRHRRDMAEHPGVRERHPRGTTLEVYRFLAEAEPAGAVMASPGFSRLVPALTGRPVVAGSERATLVFAGEESAAYARLRDRATFFAEDTSQQLRARIARRWGVAFAVFRRALVTTGAEHRWFERASAAGFHLAYVRDGTRTWSATEEGLRQRLPPAWQLVVSNRDYFVVRIEPQGGEHLPPRSPVVRVGQRRGRPVWLDVFDVHHPDRPSSGTVLASATGYPGAEVSLRPVPLGIGISDRLSWTTVRSLWDDRPNVVAIEVAMGTECIIDAVEVLPFLSPGTREVLEVSLEDKVRRLYSEEGRSLFVRIEPRMRERLTVRLRSMLGNALALTDLRLWGYPDSCVPAWEPLERSRLAGGEPTTGDLLRLAGTYPNSGRAWLGLSRDATSAGRGGDARAVLRAGLAAGPRTAAGWVELGLLRDADGAFSAALDAYRRALRVDSNSAWARGCMAWAELRSQHRLRAMYHASLAYRLDSGYADAYTIRALVAESLGMSRRSEWFLERAMELDPRRSWSFVERARSLEKLGRHDEAIALLSSFVARVPDDEDATRALARLTGVVRSG